MFQMFVHWISIHTNTNSNVANLALVESLASPIILSKDCKYPLLFTDLFLFLLFFPRKRVCLSFWLVSINWKLSGFPRETTLQAKEDIRGTSLRRKKAASHLKKKANIFLLICSLWKVTRTSSFVFIWYTTVHN